MALLIRLAVEQVGQELGRPFDRWGFVHGIWALNAADLSVCTIENEMALLMASGCFGDFSFPAGRAHCNPRLSVPFTCLPVEAVKAFDQPAARPIAAGEPGADGADRFLVWSSPLRHAECSLDAYGGGRRRPLPMTDPEACVRAWLAKSPIAEGGSLVIKTPRAIRSTRSGNVPLDEIVRAPCDAAGPGDLRLPGAGLLTAPACRSARSPAHAIPALLGPRRPLPRRASRTASVSEIHSMPKSSSAALARTINPPIVKALSEWVSEDAENARQAGRFYLERLDRGSLFADYDLVVADYLASRFDPARTRIVEIACGFGTLALLAAGHGFETLRRRAQPGTLHGRRDRQGRGGAGTAPAARPAVLPLRARFPRDFPGRALEGDKRVVAVATKRDRHLHRPEPGALPCARSSRSTPWDPRCRQLRAAAAKATIARPSSTRWPGPGSSRSKRSNRRNPYDYWQLRHPQLPSTSLASDVPASAPTWRRDRLGAFGRELNPNSNGFLFSICRSFLSSERTTMIRSLCFARALATASSIALGALSAGSAGSIGQDIGRWGPMRQWVQVACRAGGQTDASGGRR